MKRALALAAILAVVAIVSRLPYVTHLLWQWDSVLYARALEHGFHVDFNLAQSRPHPPGYVFYVGLAALFRTVLGDANAALVGVSVVASGLAVAAVFLLTRRLAGTAPALIAASAFAANPLVWLYGEVAYPYLLLAFLSVALAFLFREARARGPRWRIASSAAFGLAAGFRQDLLLLLLPLWLWMLWRAARREALGNVAAVGVASLAWFVPSALLSGGLVAYLESVVRQTQSIEEAYSVAENGISALTYNISFTLYSLAWGLFGVAALLVGAGVAAARALVRERGVSLGGDAAFFACWIVPALVLFVVVHIGVWGHVLAILPALYVLAGTALPRLGRVLARERWRRLAFAGAALVFVLVPGAAFVLGDARFSAAAIQAHEAAVAAKFAYVREHFPPETTLVLAREDYLHVQQYLPGYKTWFYDPDPHDRQANTKKGVARRANAGKTVVLFTDGLQPMRPREVAEVEVAPGVTLRYFVLEPGEAVEFVGERYGVRDSPSR